MTVESALRGAAPHLLLDSLRTSLAQQYAASSADLLLVDYGCTSLRPVRPVQTPARVRHVPVDTGPVGRVFRTQQPYLFRDDGPTATVCLPVTVRGDRLGVLVVLLPPDRATAQSVAGLGRVAETLGHALRVADRHTDLYRSTRRTRALTVAGEIQWDTLPGRGCSGPAFDLHAYWEPAYTSGGHLLDWSATEDELLLVVADGAGPGTPAALVSTLALNAIRNARRAGLDLVGQASLTDLSRLKVETAGVTVEGPLATTDNITLATGKTVIAGTPQTPSYEPNFSGGSAASASYALLTYRITAEGMLHVVGHFRSTTARAAGAYTALVLPAGYRPAKIYACTALHVSSADAFKAAIRLNIADSGSVGLATTSAIAANDGFYINALIPLT
ncbi:phosphatase [Streptomyces sp. NPDC051079]|uniref:phosphatase n=1 Tax=Streptomyces sp. NPDC051079 TaxID=3155043 RepID=UPI00344D25C6